MTALPVLGLTVDGRQGAGLLAPSAGGIPELQRLLAHTGARFLLLGAERAGGPGPRIDPSVLAGALRARWSGELPGLVVTAGPARDHPYNLARRVLALDHFTGGGTGLALVGGDRGSAASTAPGRTAWTDVAEGIDLTQEFADVLRGLWNTWPRESVVSDAAAGVFARAEAIHRLDHDGAWTVRGPLNSPSSPQGEPVLAWWVRSGTAGRFPVREFAAAATVADVVLLPADRVPQHRPPGAGPARVLAVVTDPDPRAAAAELAERGWLDGLVLAGSTPAELLDPAPARPAGGTLRARLGLPERRLDLSDNEPAFGSRR